MNAIPWYQSRVYIGAVVAIISQIVVLLGKQDVVPVEAISTNVEAAFQLIALVATGYAAWKRQRAVEQPLTLTKTGAEKLNQSGFARFPLIVVLALGAAFAMSFMSGCATPPHQVISVACTPGTTYSVERCVKGIAETWEAYQVRAEVIVADPLTPADVKKAVQEAEAASRPVVVDTLKAGAVYAEIKQQLAAGETSAEQLAIANANLEAWVAKALPLVRNFGQKLQR